LVIHIERLVSHAKQSWAYSIIPKKMVTPLWLSDEITPFIW
jgi:hypothetical protein